MKHTITLALAILLLAATGRGQSQTNQITEETVRKLAASGEICKVFGHWYPDAGIGERKCKLCGKVKTKKDVWK